MSTQQGGSLGRRLARWLALLTLAGLALTCLAVYTATALSFEERQMDTLRQKQLQVNHLIAEGGTLDNAMLTHKLDDAMVGHSNVGIILIDADDRVLYTNSAGRRLHSGAVGRVPEANPVVSAKHRTMNLRFEGKTDASSVHGLPAAELPHDAGSLVRVAASANRYAALSPNLPRHSATAYCCGYLMT